jgi:recombination protein RecA
MGRTKGSKNGGGNEGETVVDKMDVKVGKITLNADKLAAVKIAMGQIEKSFGKGSIMMLGKSPTVKTEVLSTGALSLDIALGVGGLPKGRIIEILGPEGSGKSTLAQTIVARCQKNGGIAAYIDVENAIDLKYSTNLGIDADTLLFSQPDYGEQALDIVETLVRSGGIDIIVVDSVAALVPKVEIEGEMGDQNMGLQARLMSKAMRKLTAIISKSKTIVIFINQIREKIGVMFGPTETSPGGRALKFYASVRIDVRRIESIKKGEQILGNRVKIKMVKNKVAPPFRETQLDIIFGEGIREMASLLDAAESQGIVIKSGMWYSYNDKKIGQGKDDTIKNLEDDLVLSEAIKSATVEKAFKDLKEVNTTDEEIPEMPESEILGTESKIDEEGK